MYACSIVYFAFCTIATVTAVSVNSVACRFVTCCFNTYSNTRYKSTLHITLGLHYINHGISGTERVKQEDWVAEAALSEPALRVVHQQRVPVVHGIHGTISPLRV